MSGFARIILLLLLVSPTAQAQLVTMEPVPGEFVVLDTDTNLMWAQSASLGGSVMTWDEAVTWAADLSYAGFDDWRLPASDTCEGYNCTLSEMGHLYYDEGVTHGNPSPFVDLSSSFYWSSREYATNPTRAWMFEFNAGYQTNGSKTVQRYAWPVRYNISEPDPSPVPAFRSWPGLLLSAAALALAAVWRLKAKGSRSSSHAARVEADPSPRSRR